MVSKIKGGVFSNYIILDLINWAGCDSLWVWVQAPTTIPFGEYALA